MFYHALIYITLPTVSDQFKDGVDCASASITGVSSSELLRWSGEPEAEKFDRIESGIEASKQMSSARGMMIFSLYV